MAAGDVSESLRLEPNSFVVLTGANRGLGCELSSMLARDGFSVIALCRNQRDAIAATASLPAKSGVEHHAVQMDALQPETVQDAAKKVAEILAEAQASAEGARLVGVINNAAVYLDEWSESSFDESVSVNFRAPARILQALLPHLSSSASVVNVSSGYGCLSELSKDYRQVLEGYLSEALGPPGHVQGSSRSSASLEPQDVELALSGIVQFDRKSPMRSEYVAPYKVTKAMLNCLTRVLVQRCHEIRSRNIAVNGVCPGWCRTRMGGPSASRSAAQGAQTIRRAFLGGLSEGQLKPSVGYEQRQFNGRFCKDDRFIGW